MVMRMIVIEPGPPVSVIRYDKGEGRERMACYDAVCACVLCAQSVIPGRHNTALRCSQGTSELIMFSHRFIWELLQLCAGKPRPTPADHIAQDSGKGSMNYLFRYYKYLSTEFTLSPSTPLVSQVHNHNDHRGLFVQ